MVHSFMEIPFPDGWGLFQQDTWIHSGISMQKKKLVAKIQITQT